MTTASVTVKMPKETAKRLRIEAAKRDTTRHSLIKQILADWLEKERGQRRDNGYGSSL